MHQKVLLYLVILSWTAPLLAQRPAESRAVLPAAGPPGAFRPEARVLPVPGGQAALVPPASLPGRPDVRPRAPENLITFDHRLAELQWVDNRWQLQVGGVHLTDFGRREAEAREALRLVRELRLTQRGTVGTPQPIMEYWLANGQAPQGSVPGLRLLPLDLESLRVEEIQGQWCLRNARQTFFNFGSHVEDARHALEIIQHHGFSQIGYVGQPAPVMIYFLGQPAGLAQARTLVPTPLVSRTVQSAHANGPTPLLQRTPFTDGNRSGQGNALVPPPLPYGRQLAAANPSLADVTVLAERVPFDWRRVELRRDQQDWKLVAGSYTLANFGSRQADARQALAALQYYRFTEHHLVGSPQTPTLTYFLAHGQAPRGLFFGVNSTPFRPESLSIQRAGESYVLWDGNRALWNFGDKADDARQVLQVVQRHKFDHLCRIGNSDPPAMTYFVRTR